MICIEKCNLKLLLTMVQEPVVGQSLIIEDS